MRLSLILFVVVDAAVRKRLRTDSEEIVVSPDRVVCRYFAPFLGPEFTVITRYLAESLGGFKPEEALKKIKEAVPLSKYTLEKVRSLNIKVVMATAITRLVYHLISENADKSIIDLVPIILARDAVDGGTMRTASSAFVQSWIWRKYCIDVEVDCQYDVTKNIWRFKIRAIRAFLNDISTCPENSSFDGLVATSKAQNSVRPGVDDPLALNTLLTNPDGLTAPSARPRLENAQIPRVPFHTLLMSAIRDRMSSAEWESANAPIPASELFVEILNRNPGLLESRRRRVLPAAMPAAVQPMSSLAIPAANDPGLTVSSHSAPLKVLPPAVCQFLTFRSASKDANVAFRQYLLTSYLGRRDAGVCLEEMKQGDIHTSLTREEVGMMIKRFEGVNRISVGGYERLHAFAHRSEDEVSAIMTLVGYDIEIHDLFISGLYVWSKYCFGFEERNCRLVDGIWTIDRLVMQAFMRSLDICNS